MRRIISIAIVLCILVSAFPAGVASAADADAFNTTGRSSTEKLHDVTISTDAKVYEENDVTPGDDIITRAAWVQELVKIFDMTVEEAHAPDNFFTDLTGEESYYRDILVAVQFGVVDIPAGEAFYPENAATREFAAQTLNSCLGYLHEPSDGYTFSESDTVTYPDAIQIAINRGWFQLSGSNFLPEQAITTAEKSTMLTDAAATLESRVIDTNYRNTYTFKKGVIEIPQGTDVEIMQNTVTIKNCPKTLKAGDVFVVWYQSVPCAYVASAVTVAGTTTTIAATAVSDGSAVTDADAQGILDTEFAQFVPDAGTEVVYVDEVTGIEYTDAKEADCAIAAHQATRGTKKLKTLQLKSTVDLGSGISASVTAKLKDPVLEYKFSSKKKVASVILTAEYEVSVEAKAELIDHAATKKLRLGFWGCPGVGGIEVCMVYSLSGSITGSFTGTLCVGAEYQSGAGFSLPKTFKSKGFSFIVEASFKSGLQINFGINDVPCDLMSGQVYAEIGAKGSVKRTSYSDDATPNICVHTAMYIYLECGAKLTFKVANFKSEYSREYKVWKDSNSPVRVVHHYEDGKEVCSCTRGQTYGDNGYYTVGTSNYWGSGWSGGSGGTGYDRNGNPIPVFEYSVDDDGNAIITKYHGTGASVTIPDTIDGHTVVAIGRLAFYNCGLLQTVSIPDSVTSIGNSAFDGCAALGQLKLPANLKKIGGAVFADCKNLKTIYIPKTLENADTAIGRNSWVGPFGDSGLEKVTFEAGTTSVVGNLFNGAKNLIDVELLNTENRAFVSGMMYDLELTTEDGATIYYTTDGSEPTRSSNIYNGAIHLEDTTLVTAIAVSDGKNDSECVRVYFVYDDTPVDTDTEDAVVLDTKEIDVAPNMSIPLEVEIQYNPGLIGYSLVLECDRSVFYIDAEDENRICTPGDASKYGSFTVTPYYESGWKITWLSSYPSTENGILFTIPLKVGEDAEFGKHEVKLGYMESSIYAETGNSISLNKDIVHFAGTDISHTHTYTDTITAPTCAEQGYTLHMCFCGDSYIDTYVDALGHAWDDGVITVQPTDENTGEKTYTCSRCGLTRTEIIPATGGYMPCDGSNCPGRVFSDMPVHGSWAHDPIDWTITGGVTNGTSATTFSPEEGCTRAQVVTFLWRAAGQPEPTSSSNPFADVKAGQYYYKAVLWAVEHGITNGMSATEFGPDNTCTRAQIVTFLWRYEGKPAPSSTHNPFADVNTGSYYGSAVLWAVEHGITNGMSATEFCPENTCTRAQVVTFLYRDVVNQ